VAATKPGARIDRAHVIVGLAPAERDDVLKDFVDRLVALGAFPEEAGTTVLRAVLKRERVGSTGVGRGIAIPHAKTSAIEKQIVAFARVAEPIPYGATDGADVHSLFLVLSPAEAHDDHMTILKWIASIARSDYYSKVLKNTSDPDSLHSLFLETDGPV
jgi:PTS system fructose-specific IIA component/PTS system nitrogen regulatory IIA component